MTLGSLLGALLILAWSQTNSLLCFYLIWAGLGLAMSATLYEVAFTVVAVWFRRHRARAMFTVTMVAGLASTIFVPLTTLLVAQLGLRPALLVLAAILAFTCVTLHALVLRRHPQALGLEPDGLAPEPAPGQAAPDTSVSPRVALSTARFWWLVAAFALARFSFAAMGAHLVPLLLERGYSAALVALAVGAVGPLQLLGRMFFLPLHSRWPIDRVTAVMFTCAAVAFASLAFVPDVIGVGVFVVLYGASNGAMTLARAEIIAERYGAAHYGSISGALASPVSLTGALAPFAVGVMYASISGYHPVLWLLCLTSALGVLAINRSQVRPIGVIQDVPL